MLPVTLLGQGNPTTQQSDSPAPIQPARPLNLQPALRPPVADTGIFSPLAPPSRPTRSGGADGAPGTEVLAAAGGLHDQGHAGHRGQAAHRDRADPLHQQLARHARIRLDAGGPEPVPARQHRVAAVRLREPVRRRRVLWRVRDRFAFSSAAPHRNRQRERSRPGASAGRRLRPRFSLDARSPPLKTGWTTP